MSLVTVWKKRAAAAASMPTAEAVGSWPGRAARRVLGGPAAALNQKIATAGADAIAVAAGGKAAEVAPAICHVATVQRHLRGGCFSFRTSLGSPGISSPRGDNSGSDLPRPCGVTTFADSSDRSITGARLYSRWLSTRPGRCLGKGSRLNGWPHQNSSLDALGHHHSPLFMFRRSDLEVCRDRQSAWSVTTGVWLRHPRGASVRHSLPKLRHLDDQWSPAAALSRSLSDCRKKKEASSHHIRLHARLRHSKPPNVCDSSVPSRGGGADDERANTHFLDSSTSLWWPGASSNSSRNPLKRVVTISLASVGSAARLSRRGLSSHALRISEGGIRDVQRHTSFVSGQASGGEGNDFSGSYRKQGCAGSTLRFVYNNISDRWCVIQKPPGWSLLAHPRRPSVASVLQPLLDVAIAARSCSLVAGGVKGDNYGLRRLSRKSQNDQRRRNSSGRPLLPQGMLQEMEVETADQDELRGLFFPFQLDADAQGLVLVATDAQMNALLCRLLDEEARIIREYRVLSDVSRLLACRAPSNTRGIFTHHGKVSRRRSSSRSAGTDNMTDPTALVKRNRNSLTDRINCGLSALPYFFSSTHWGWSLEHRVRLAAPALQTPRAPGGACAATRRVSAVCHDADGFSVRVAGDGCHSEDDCSLTLRYGSSGSFAEDGHRESCSSTVGKEPPYTVSKSPRDCCKCRTEAGPGGNSTRSSSRGNTREVLEEGRTTGCRVFRNSAPAAVVTEDAQVQEFAEDSAAEYKGVYGQTKTNGTGSSVCNPATLSQEHPVRQWRKPDANGRTRRSLTKAPMKGAAGNARYSDFFTALHRCLRLYDVHRGELLEEGKLVSSVSQRHAALRSTPELTAPAAALPAPLNTSSARRELCAECFSPAEEDSWDKSHPANEHHSAVSTCTHKPPRTARRKMELRPLARRSLVQLMDGSFFTGGLAEHLCRNILGHSVCSGCTLFTPHPLHADNFVSPPAAGWTGECGIESAAHRGKPGFLSVADNGVSAWETFREGKRTLACTHFALLSLHRRRLVDGGVRTLGLYRVSLQAGPQKTHQIRVHFSEAGAPLANDALYNPRFCRASINGRLIPSCAVDPVVGPASLGSPELFTDDDRDLTLPSSSSLGTQSNLKLPIHSSSSRTDFSTRELEHEDSNRQNSHFANDVNAPHNVSDAKLCLKPRQYNRLETLMEQSFHQAKEDPNCVFYQSACFSIAPECHSSDEHLALASHSLCRNRTYDNSSTVRSDSFSGEDGWTPSFSINSPKVSKEAKSIEGDAELPFSCVPHEVKVVAGDFYAKPCKSETRGGAAAAIVDYSALACGKWLKDELSASVAACPETVSTPGTVHGVGVLSTTSVHPHNTATEEDPIGATLNGFFSGKTKRGRQSLAKSRTCVTSGRIAREKRREEGWNFSAMPGNKEKQSEICDQSSGVCDSLGLQLFRLVMPDPLRLDAATQLVFEIGPPPEWGGILD